MLDNRKASRKRLYKRLSVGVVGVAGGVSIANAQPVESSAEAATRSVGVDGALVSKAAEFVSGGPEWLFTDLIGSEVWRWIGFFVSILLLIAARKLIKIPLFRRVRAWAKSTKTAVDTQLVNAIEPPLDVIWWVFTIYLSLKWMNWPEGWAQGTDLLFRLATIIAFGWAIFRASDLFQMMMGRLTSRTQTTFDDQLVPFFVQMFKLVVICITFVIILQEFGVNAAAIIGALGVGSLAVALAAESTFSNWFGALMLYTDQPFVVGDWIKTEDVEGIVEDIGMRSTEVRTFSKTVVSVPNSRIAAGFVENFSRMPKRRVYYHMTVDFESTPKMLGKAVKAIEDVLSTHEGVDHDEFVVRFSEIVQSGYNILVLYWTETTSFDEYMTIKQQVHLAILETLGAFGVKPALPRQVVRYEKGAEPAMLGEETQPKGQA